MSQINTFIFNILLSQIGTFGATRSNQLQKVVHKDWRAVNAAKVRENDKADSEFCEGGGERFLYTKETMIFRWEWIPGEIPHDTCCPEMTND